jgi:hypothetical protein
MEKDKILKEAKRNAERTATTMPLIAFVTYTDIRNRNLALYA